MESLKSIPDLLLDWLPVSITILIGTLILTVAYQLLIKRAPAATESFATRQLLMAALTGILVIAIVLELPIGEAARGQLLSLLGILVTAAIALSSDHVDWQRHGGADAAVDSKLPARGLHRRRWTPRPGFGPRVTAHGDSNRATQPHNAAEPVPRQQPRDGGAPFGDLHRRDGVARLRRATRKDREAAW